MKYRYRTEEEMKDSGIEWLGKIPKEWGISRISKEFIVRNEKVSDKDFAPLSVTKQGILPQLESVAKSDNGDNRKKVCVGDFVINSRADRKGSCGVSSYDGSVSLICNVLTPKYLDSQYIHSLFRSYYFSEEFYRWGSGIVDDLWSTNIERMKKINMPKPNKNEDKKIARFLDEKTAQFDSIISKKEALIDRLEEAKKSFISEVVTGKVKVVKTDNGYELVERKKEEMKGSGVEWIKFIPNEWHLKRSNYVFKFSKGLSITKENLQDEGIPCINYGEIHSKYGFEVNPQKHKLKCVAQEYFNSSSNALIKYGDFVFADTSEDIQGCGNFSYLNAEDSIFAGYHTVIARPIEKVNSRYLAYLFDSDNWRIQIRAKVSGIKVFSITQSILKTTKVILPTLSEQKLIVDYLDNKFISINSMINNMQKQIDKLKEAKKSLISEAVTGKIEVLD